eukprot:7360277-Alexandrium_andersonii.AAC.1
MTEVNAARDREATPTSPAEDAPPVATTATPATRQARAEPRNRNNELAQAPAQGLAKTTAATATPQRPLQPPRRRGQGRWGGGRERAQWQELPTAQSNAPTTTDYRATQRSQRRINKQPEKPSNLCANCAM